MGVMQPRASSISITGAKPASYKVMSCPLVHSIEITYYRLITTPEKRTGTSNEDLGSIWVPHFVCLGILVQMG
jgi:hypothetical protein